jgi:cytochrome c oxidase subunit III
MAGDISPAAVVELSGEEKLQGKSQTQGPPPFSPEPPDDFGDGDAFGDDSSGPPISNARVGMLVFLGAETMFFAGLISTFLVFRLGHQIWPPAALPRLPVEVTGVNTLILLGSAYTMWRALRAVRLEAPQRFWRMLLYTAILGIVFLGIQGYEWIQLVRFGLTLQSGIYGATFYTLIGCHGLHVFGAVIWLLAVLRQAGKNRYTARQHMGVAVCAMYWYYVVALWPILYGLVYLY